jgi:hypothetical protein
VSEEPQDSVFQEEQDSEPVRDFDGTEELGPNAETSEADDSEADFEAHGSWGGIG